MATRFIDHLLAGDHASRPAFGDVPQGTLYACSDHDLIYQSDGTSAWATWATVGAVADILDLPTAELDDTLVLAPDGAGGVEFRAAAAGSVATDAIWDAAGDLAVGSGANTAARLALGATNGMALRRVSGAVAWDLPPGHEFSYVEFTAPVTVSATVEASANVVVTAAEITFDGSTAVIVELWAPYIVTGASTASVLIDLFDGSTALGITAQITQGGGRTAGLITVRLTPSAAAHTYSWRAWRADSNGTIQAGAGGAGAYMPGYIRIVKAA